MNRCCCFLVVFVFSCALHRVSSQLLNITLFSNTPNNVRELGASDSNVPPLAILACGVHADVSFNIVLQHFWYINGAQLTQSTFNDRISQQNGMVFRNNILGTTLYLSRLSYSDSGEYRCESRGQVVNTGQLVDESLTIILRLIVRLEAIAESVQTFNDSQQVRLGCDMAGYIHPDADLYWNVNGSPVKALAGYGSKYAVSYSNGSHVAQYGGQTMVPSRVAWLSVFDVKMGDSNVEYSCAINGTGLSKRVSLIVDRASAPSGPPTNIAVSAISSTSVRVEWSRVRERERRGNITHYQILLSALNETKSVLAPVTERSVKVLGLEEFTVYRVTMRAFTVVGPGPYSVRIVFKTLEDVPTAPPQSINATVLSPTIIILSWQPVPARQRNGIVTRYEVEYNQSTFPEIPPHKSISTVNLSIALVGLHEFVEYGIRVRAHTALGGGPLSVIVMVTTHEDKPLLPPRILSLVSFNSSALGVSWGAPPDIHINGVLRYYVLIVCPSLTTTDTEYGSGSKSGPLLPDPDICLTVNVPGAVGDHVLTNLEEVWSYQVSIAAVTVAQGPSTSDSVRMGNSVVDVTPGSKVNLGPLPVFPLVGLSCSIDLPTLIRNTTLVWQWRKTGGKRLGGEMSRYQVFSEQDTLTSTLTIDELRHSDSGLYECSVYYSEWDNVPINSTTVELQLQYEITATSPVITLTKDDTFLHLECLLCGYTPSLELHWYQETAATIERPPTLQRITTNIRHEADKASQSQTGGKLPGFGARSVLFIAFPTEGDAGRYICALPDDLRANATIDVQLLSTEVPVSENNFNGVIIGVVVAVIVFLVVVIATATTLWCIFCGYETKSPESPSHQGSIEAHDFVSVHSGAVMATRGDIDNELPVKL